MARSERHVYREIDGHALELDLVAPDGADGPARPAVVFFHGGAWRMGHRDQFLGHCQFLAERGAIGVTASYRLADPEAGRSPLECADDAAYAVGWLRERAAALGIDPARLAAGGGSAGGQLAAAVAAMGIPLAALVLFNPALAPDGSPRLVFMGDAGPDWGVDARFPPALVVHGTADHIVPVETARAFAQAMAQHARPCELVEYDDMPHGFFNAKAPDGRRDETLADMARFLAKHGLLGDAG